MVFGALFIGLGLSVGCHVLWAKPGRNFGWVLALVPVFALLVLLVFHAFSLAGTGVREPHLNEYGEAFLRSLTFAPAGWYMLWLDRRHRTT